MFARGENTEETNNERVNNMAEIKALTYLRQELAVPTTPFVAEWGKLTDKDKADLREYAVEEGKARGVNVVA